MPGYQETYSNVLLISDNIWLPYPHYMSALQQENPTHSICLVELISRFLLDVNYTILVLECHPSQYIIEAQLLGFESILLDPFSGAHVCLWSDAKGWEWTGLCERCRELKESGELEECFTPGQYMSKTCLGLKLYAMMDLQYVIM